MFLDKEDFDFVLELLIEYDLMRYFNNKNELLYDLCSISDDLCENERTSNYQRLQDIMSQLNSDKSGDYNCNILIGYLSTNTHTINKRR